MSGRLAESPWESVRKRRLVFASVCKHSARRASGRVVDVMAWDTRRVRARLSRVLRSEMMAWDSFRDFEQYIQQLSQGWVKFRSFG